MIAAYVGALRGAQPNVRLLLSISAIAGFTIDGGIYSVIFNLYLLRLDYGPAFVGQVSALANLVFAFGSILGGGLGSRFGERRVMVVGMTLVLAGATCIPLTSNMPEAWRASWLMASNVLLYFGLAQYFANAGPFLLRSIQSAARGNVFAMQSAITSIASFAGGLLGGLLPALVVAVLGAPLIGSTPYQVPLIVAGGFMYLAMFFLLRTNNEVLVATEGAAGQPGAPALTAAYGLVAFMALIRFLQVSVVGAGMTFFNVYMDSELGVATATIGLVAASARLLSVPAALLAPTLGRRFGYGAAAAFAAGGAALSSLPLALAAGAPGASAGFIGMMAFTSLRYPAFYVYMMERTPDRLRALMTGANEMAAGLSFALIALVGGYVIVNYGYAAAFLAAGAMSLAGTLVFYGYVRMKGE